MILLSNFEDLSKISTKGWMVVFAVSIPIVFTFERDSCRESNCWPSRLLALFLEIIIGCFNSE
jgi:hypothetical protein